MARSADAVASGCFFGPRGDDRNAWASPVVGADRWFRLLLPVVAAAGPGAGGSSPTLALSPGVLWSLGWSRAFWALCALLLLAELRPLFTAGVRDLPTGWLLLSTALVFALLLRYGLPVAVVVQAAPARSSPISAVLGKAPWRTAFNIGQFALSWSAAATVHALFGCSATPRPRRHRSTWPGPT